MRVGVGGEEKLNKSLDDLKCIKIIIHHNQVGFIQYARQVQHSKSINVIHHNSKLKNKII